MSYIDNRLRMLLEQCEAACQVGWLTQPMLDSAVRETMAYREPAASDIRNLLKGLRIGVTPSAEILARLKQAQFVLHTTASYD